MTSTEYLDDGTVKVIIEEEGFRAVGWVSSAHLVPQKEAQLLRALSGGTEHPDM
jgi:hypothetical protein